MLPPCSRRMQTVDDAFLRLSTNYQAAMRGASSAALLCNLAALGNLCLPNAYSRAAGLRPFKNGFRNHDWCAHSRCGLLALGLSRHPSVLQAASSRGAFAFAPITFSQTRRPRVESLWLITDLSRTPTPTLFTTPRTDLDLVMLNSSGACSRAHGSARLVRLTREI